MVKPNLCKVFVKPMVGTLDSGTGPVMSESHSIHAPQGLTSKGGTMARSTTRTAQSDPVAALAAQVAALTEMVAALTAGTTQQATTPKPTTRTRSTAKSAKPKSGKGSKVYTWKPWACAKFGIPAVVGASFAYNGKNGTTDHVVTSVSADGIVTSVRA